MFEECGRWSLSILLVHLRQGGWGAGIRGWGGEGGKGGGDGDKGGGGRGKRGGDGGIGSGGRKILGAGVIPIFVVFYRFYSIFMYFNAITGCQKYPIGILK